MHDIVLYRDKTFRSKDTPSQDGSTYRFNKGLKLEKLIKEEKIKLPVTDQSYDSFDNLDKETIKEEVNEKWEEINFTGQMTLYNKYTHMKVSLFDGELLKIR